MHTLTLYGLIILFLPLVSFVYQIFFGRVLGPRGAWLSVGALAVTLVLSLTMLVSLFMGHEIAFTPEVLWFTVGDFSLTLGFQFDNISVVMLVVVAIISSLAHLYSIEYMRGDVRYTRYFGYLGLFTFSMNGIVLAHSLIMMYVFWELVGLSSYLLIGHWFEKDSAADAGKKAFLTNRVGDIGMFIGIMLLWTVTGSFTFQGLYELIDVESGNMFAGQMGLLTIAGVLVFLGAIGKSAQFPLHIWLPDAMEGPTPVSALIHAATMVAAGVYLTVRMFPILTPDALLVVGTIGAITAVLGALIAITQNDIKRVLAYSTVSQLGYMIMAVGMGAQQAAFFHLSTHAMFKGLLFLCSGSVIHALHHALVHEGDHSTDHQDMRNMGGLRSKMPITYITMLIGALTISGVPLFSGFLSKDAILAGTLAFAHEHHVWWANLFPIAGFGAAAITAFYMFRLIFMTFHGKPANAKVNAHVHESPAVMTIPLMTLAVLSFALFFTLPGLNPMSAEGWFAHLIHQMENLTGYAALSWEHLEHGFHEAHHLTVQLSFAVAGTGIMLAIVFYLLGWLSPAAWAERLKKAGLYQASFHKFYFDEIYDKVLYQPFLWLTDKIAWLDWDWWDQRFIDSWGRNTVKAGNASGWVDYFWLDQIVIDGIGRIIRWMGAVGRKMQTGRIQNYLMWALAGGLIILVLANSF
ncbi:MAG: NADH-quinone oxidoreductase subunit L [Candidatus Marinimicrobia bacterium]|nr:NADH-quinone oxidoreductase subunit L [Candidatus Neomarinimicrobiota bacterium]